MTLLKRLRKFFKSKTIRVDPKTFDALMALSKEITEQDNRFTALPLLFQVQSEETVAAYEGTGTKSWIDEDCDIMSKDRIKEVITESEQWKEYTEIALVKLAKSDSFSKMSNEEKEDTMYNNLPYYEKESILEGLDCRIVEETTKEVYTNAFFIAKACELHIKQNLHRYNRPICYTKHAWRNPEMELVAKFITGLTKT